MTHIRVRAEQRPHEQRFGLTPQGAAEFLKNDFQVSVEDSHAGQSQLTAIAMQGAEFSREQMARRPGRRDYIRAKRTAG